MFWLVPSERFSAPVLVLLRGEIEPYQAAFAPAAGEPEYVSDELYGGADSDSLNGGDDGLADKLVGGSGFDYFQQDWGWKRNYYYGYGVGAFQHLSRH